MASMLVDKVEALVTERRHASSRTPAPTSVILSGEMEESASRLMKIIWQDRQNEDKGRSS
jgi:hypothetical protein